MMKPLNKALAGMLPALLALTAVAANDAKTAEDIRACAGDNAPETTMVQELRIESRDRADGRRNIDAKMFYKRFDTDEMRTTLQVRAPIDLSGTSYLMIDKASDDRLLLYLPSMERVRRVSGGGAAESMLGTDFSYEDMKQLRAMSAGGELARLDDTDVAGRDAYRVALTPPPGDESAYERVRFTIDKKTCVPLVIDFFESGDEPRKRYRAEPDSLVRVGERWLAEQASMRDLRDGTRTDLTVTSVTFDEDVSDSVFNRRTFYLGAYGAALSSPENAG